jgi:hypothetical protein
VLAINVGTNTTQETITNQEGHSRISAAARRPLRAAGRAYRFFRPDEAPNSRSTPVRVRALISTLALGAVSEQVQVVSAAPQVNTTTTDLGVVMTRDRVESLPLTWPQLSDAGRTAVRRIGVPVHLHRPARRHGIKRRPGVRNQPAARWCRQCPFGENSAPALRSRRGSRTAVRRSTRECGSHNRSFKTSSSAFSAEYGQGHVRRPECHHQVGHQSTSRNAV